MSLPPITIPDLDPAGPIDRNNDLLLLRQGLNDKKATVAQISNLDISSFSALPGAVLSSDRIIIGRNNGGGTYTNYIADPRSIGFLPGVRMWFYADNAPLYWQIVPGLTDRLLAIKGGSNGYQNSGSGGQWQQLDVSGVTNRGLSITQIPNHNHYAQFGQNQSNKNATYIHGAQNIQSGGDPKFGKSPSTDPVRGVVGAKGDNASHDNYGDCDPHNHGNNWRPLAAIGQVCQHIATPN